MPAGRPLRSKNTHPDVERQVEIACKRISQTAVNYLEMIIEKALGGEQIDPKVVMIAIKEVFDRGLGKARQQIDQNINVNGGEALVEAIQQARMRVLEKATDAIKATTKLN
jgi:hypothetical protein